MSSDMSSEMSTADAADDAAVRGIPRTMTAWCQDQYGGPEVVTRQSIDVPAPGKGEVLLAVQASSLNSADVRVMRGEPLLLRAAFGLRRPAQRVRGIDAAGAVVALGPGVADVSIGDRVVCELPSGGALAPFAIAPVKRLVALPESLDAAIASTLPLAAGTAWQALDRAAVASGHRVLVIGASGGVGTFAVQLATLRGAEVWALSGARSESIVAGLGAVATFDYKKVQPGSPELGAASFDAVIDIAGTAPLRALQRLVRDGGTVVLVSGEGSRFFGPIRRLAAASIRSLGSKRRVKPLAAVAKPEILRQLVALAASGTLTPAIERTWSLAHAGAALARLDSKHTVGKVVVTVP